jgi:sortase A
VVQNVGVTDVDEPGPPAEQPRSAGQPARRDESAEDVADASVGIADDPDLDEDLDDESADPAATSSRGRGRRITFWIGVGLILGGLGLLGYVGWQFWGTNWVAKKHQRQLTSQIQQEWTTGRGCDKFCPKGATIALIRIPTFGASYVVPVLEGTDKATVLDKGAFGHFTNTAGPGQVGNFALAAHRVTHGEPLRHMPDLRPGDKIIVETRKSTFTYVLDTNPNQLVIPFTGVWVLDALPHNPNPGGPEPAQVPGQRLITLTTCSEIFHTDNRMIAFGHLVDTQKKTVPVPTRS